MDLFRRLWPIPAVDTAFLHLARWWVSEGISLKSRRIAKEKNYLNLFDQSLPNLSDFREVFGPSFEPRMIRVLPPHLAGCRELHPAGCSEQHPAGYCPYIRPDIDPNRPYITHPADNPLNPAGHAQIRPDVIHIQPDLNHLNSFQTCAIHLPNLKPALFVSKP